MTESNIRVQKLLEQIRNLLALQLLRTRTGSNDEIAELLGITPGRTSQLFAKGKRKRRTSHARDGAAGARTNEKT